jgi:nicotinamidase-related amidase
MEQRINTSQFGVVIVDMQPTYLRNILEGEKTDLIRNQLALLERCLQRDIPVIAFEGQNPYSMNYVETIPELKSKIKQLKRRQFFEKEFDDGFTYYPLVNEQVTSWKINTLCFTGINAAACVQETAEGALNQDYKVLTAEDLLADRVGIGGITHAKNWFEKNGNCYSSYQDILKNLK